MKEFLKNCTGKKVSAPLVIRKNSVECLDYSAASIVHCPQFLKGYKLMADIFQILNPLQMLCRNQSLCQTV